MVTSSPCSNPPWSRWLFDETLQSSHRLSLLFWLIGTIVSQCASTGQTVTNLHGQGSLPRQPSNHTYLSHDRPRHQLPLAPFASAGCRRRDLIVDPSFIFTPSELDNGLRSRHQGVHPRMDEKGTPVLVTFSNHISYAT